MADIRDDLAARRTYPDRNPADASLAEPYVAADVQRTADGLELTLTGDWGCRQFAALEAQLDAIDLSDARQVRIDAEPLGTLDLSGAWALHQFIARARSVGSEVSFKGSAPEQLRLLDETLQEAQKGVEAPPPRPLPPEHGPIMQLLVRVGRQAERTRGNWREGLAFLGRTFTTGAAALLRPRRLRPISIARHVYETGITAMPIVALIAFLISVIIAYMSAPAAARPRRRHLCRRPGHHRRAARAGRAADGDHRRRPLRQRLRRGDRLDEAQPGGRCADRHRRRPV